MLGSDRGEAQKMISKIFFGIYLIGLFWLIVLKFNVAFLWIGKERSLNLVPYAELLFNESGKIDYGELILNALVFVPFGIFNGTLFKSLSVLKSVISFFIFSLTCEFLQYVMAVGAADATDVVNNTLGGLTGLMVYRGIRQLYHEPAKADRLIRPLLIGGTFILVLFFLYLRINELWMFRMHTIRR